MKHIVVLCSLLLLLTACRAADTPAATVAPTAVPPTATTEPTDTPRPSPTTEPTDAPTATPEPTATDEPTPTPRPSPMPRPSPSPSPTFDLGLGDVEKIVVQGGFAYRPFLTGIETDVQTNEVAFTSDTFIASLNGFATDNNAPLASVLPLSLQLMNENLPDADLQAGEPYPITVDGVEGLAADLSGTLFGDPVLGQLLVMRPAAGQFFNAFALSNTGGGDAVWTEEGSVLFATLLDSVRFFPIAPLPTTTAPEATAAPAGPSACPVATDVSYGFTEANAIRVGGGAFGGPSRAEAYLNTLRGPAGQAVAYTRIGSQPFEETILDAYEVKYEGAAQTAILYVDQYAFETLYAPVGFTCAIAFPLTAP